ncbi:related to dehydrogenase/reductase [Phialocephala subalpina]|uniref:Related to dehydrogenase/reductase n=1 Tax=Phialocephala subalpina TaxID=576137 RepID=A0A1L7WU07_9HELO|nr:related to dehydrogenase/reductase [Phialocephala subalpina]
MVNLKGSVLITGANGGLGSAFVANFSKSEYGKEYRGLFTVRNPATAKDLTTVLEKAPANLKSEVIALDLSSIESIRGVAADINVRIANGTLEPIRALVLNAAFQDANSEALKPKTFTKDGFEMNFGVNYLANFLFILMILQSMDKENGRIVIVQSWTHDTDHPRNNSIAIFSDEEYKMVFTDTETLAKGVTYTDSGYKAGMRRYGASKTLMMMFHYELQRRLDADPALSNISVVSMDPAAMGGTGITRTSPFLIRFLLRNLIPLIQEIAVWFNPNGFMRPPWKSAADLMLASFDEKKLGQHPKAVYLDGSENATPSVEARDEMKQKKLWDESLKLARIRDGDTVLKNWQ